MGAQGSGYNEAPHADDIEWQMQGLCSSGDYDITMWESQVDGESTREKRRRTARAIAVCKLCPVVKKCAEWSIERKERYGIWGGLTEMERRALFKRRWETSPDLYDRPKVS